MKQRTRPQLRYSEEFKRMVVEEIESGVMNVAQACRYYGISVRMSIYKWLELYGMSKQKGQKVLVMSYKEENELVRLRRELALMKKELEEAELRAIAWKSMVDAIEQDLGIPVKKKPWSQALQEAKQQLYPDESDSMSKNSAASTDSVSRQDTKDKRPLRKK
jgi:transposase-like protein